MPRAKGKQAPRWQWPMVAVVAIAVVVFVVLWATGTIF